MIAEVELVPMSFVYGVFYICVRCPLQEQLRKLEGRQARAGAAAASEVDTALTTVSRSSYCLQRERAHPRTG
jgi:hypothetical protein